MRMHIPVFSPVSVIDFCMSQREEVRGFQLSDLFGWVIHSNVSAELSSDPRAYTCLFIHWCACACSVDDQKHLFQVCAFKMSHSDPRCVQYLNHTLQPVLTAGHFQCVNMAHGLKRARHLCAMFSNNPLKRGSKTWMPNWKDMKF